MTIKITDATFENEIKHGVTLVDFYADWCGPCKAIAPTLEKLSKEFEGKIKIGKINVDENQAIPSSLGIMSIPTLILYKDGKMIEKKVGGLSESAFKEWFNKNI